MLGYILVVGALVLGLATGNDLIQVGGFFLEGLLSWTTLQLLGVVMLIEMLSVFMQLTGSLQRILAALRGVIEDSRVLIALVPSLLGLLPVPGGAALSAPMVGSYGDEMGLDIDRKSGINLFFRHVWDLVFPFKPHIILASAVLNIPLFTLIGWHLPVTIVTALFGFWYLVARRSGERTREVVAASGQAAGRPLWIELAPLLLPLIIALGLGVDFLFAMAVGLLVGVVTQGASRAMLEKMVAKGFHPRMFFLLASVMVFKTVVDHTGMVKGLALALTSFGVPIAFLVIALPMAIAFTTGLEIAATGMAFPLLVGLIPSGTPVLPYVLVMMIANGIGQTLSPVHTCMVVGNEYFGARLGPVIRMNLLPQTFRLSLGIVFAWALGSYVLR